jgi:hypothetical protein
MGERRKKASFYWDRIWFGVLALAQDRAGHKGVNLCL